VGHISDTENIFAEEDALARRDPDGYRLNVDGERVIKVTEVKKIFKAIFKAGKVAGWKGLPVN
jgi:hypothetical protein